MNKELTSKQKNFYNSLLRLISEYGKSPTISELVRLMKFSSPRAVTQYLEALEQKGFIERARYEHRGIKICQNGEKTNNSNTFMIPLIASAGCENLNSLAERNFGDFICVSSELLKGKNKDNVVCIKAIGDSMVEAGINSGDYVLVEVTEAVIDNDLVVAIIDSNAVIKKISIANNAVILYPVSSDPVYKPIILHRDFKIFGKVIEVIRLQSKGELEIVPLYDSPEDSYAEYTEI